jgi:hypothetical protein
MSEKKMTRREFIEKAVYMAPVVLTLAAAPSFAQAGSVSTKTSRENWKGKGSVLGLLMKSN